MITWSKSLTEKVVLWSAWLMTNKRESAYQHVRSRENHERTLFMPVDPECAGATWVRIGLSIR